MIQNRPRRTQAEGAVFARTNLGRALADLDEAIRLDPKSPDAYCKRGAVHQMPGNLDSALADLNESIQLDPKSPDAYCNRGGVYVNLGKLDRALGDLDEAIRLAPKAPLAYSNRGAVHQQLGDFDSALADLDKAIRLDPQAPACLPQPRCGVHKSGQAGQGDCRFGRGYSTGSEICESLQYSRKSIYGPWQVGSRASGPQRGHSIGSKIQYQ